MSSTRWALEGARVERFARQYGPGTGNIETQPMPWDPPLAFTKTLDRAFQPTASGKHINFLEIYEGDFLAPEMQGVLRDAAARISRP